MDATYLGGRLPLLDPAPSRILRRRCTTGCAPP